MHDMNAIVGSHDILWITLDTLRYDVAQRAFLGGKTPCMARLLPVEGWEKRHTPGSFTFAAHAAFFAGFLPTPVAPGPHPRLFAAQFTGSESTGAQTWEFRAADVPTGLAAAGYHTVCIGGVGFFNKRNELGLAFPRLFEKSHWEPEFGVTDPQSTRHQVRRALAEIEASLARKLFLFLNVSALHQPNCIFSPGAKSDNAETMEAALAYVDSQLPPLIDALLARGPFFFVLMSDHGTAYGENGYAGHRLAHPIIWEVPYAEGICR